MAGRGRRQAVRGKREAAGGMRGIPGNIAVAALGVVGAAGVLGAMGAVTPAAWAGAGEVVVLDRGLAARAVTLVGFGDRGALVRDGGAAGEPEVVPLDSVAAIVPAAWYTPEDDAVSAGRGVDAGRSAAERGGWGMLEFTDGQRTVGRLVAAGAEADERVRWESNLLGQLVAPLERLARIRMEGFAGVEPGAAAGLAAPGAGGTDVVLLTNGDVLRGYVEAVGTQVRVKTDAGAAAVDAVKVREIRLAQPAVPATGTFVWLADGTVVRAERLGAEPGGRAASLVRMIVSADEGRAQRVGLNVTQIKAVVPRAQGIAALSSLVVARQELGAGRLGGGAIRTVPAPDAVLGAQDIELPGPMSVDWAVPSGVRVVAGWAVLPETAREWGACTLALGLIDDAGGLIAGTSAELSGGAAVAAVRLEAPPGAKPALLRATLVAGPYGPIQCRVTLRRVLLSRE